MPNAAAHILLWGSPIILTLACAGCGIFLSLIKSGFGGSSKSNAPVVIAAIVLWLLHAGYILGPWLWAKQRIVLGLGLMIPIAALMMLAIIVFGGRIASDPTGPRGEDNHMNLFFVVLVVAIVVYGGPVIAMLAAKPDAPSGF
jgi:hypothetical protein